jgi:ribonuclease BN (tRNA processing enzyme)
MSLKVIALGTGTCSDTPQTKQSRQPPGFLITVDDQHILFDCSEGIRFRLQAHNIDIAHVQHVAISHAHPDHAALPQFIQAKYCRLLFGASGTKSTKLHIFLPKILARDFPQVWNWHQPENDGAYWKEFTPQIIGVSDGFEEEIFPGAVLKAYTVYHGYGRHPAVGFRLETKYGTVAYTGDSGVCDGVKLLSQKVDLLIADCSTSVGQEYTGGYGHMGPRQCGDLARTSGVKKLWLTHYFDSNDPEVMKAEVREAGFFGDTAVAKDGEEWSA